jgi:hypothetical protein
MEKVVDDHNLRDAFKLRHEVVGAQWNPESSHWIITIRRNGDDADVFEDWCDVFVNGSGEFSVSINATVYDHRINLDLWTQACSMHGNGLLFLAFKASRALCCTLLLGIAL